MVKVSALRRWRLPLKYAGLWQRAEIKPATPGSNWSAQAGNQRCCRGEAVPTSPKEGHRPSLRGEVPARPTPAPAFRTPYLA